MATLAWLRAESVPHVVIGGVAVSLLGEPRTTLDLDVLGLADQDDWARLVEAGAAHGLLPRISDAATFAAHSRVLLMLHEPSGVPVDVALGTLPFERDAISHAETIDLHGVQIPLPRVEDLIIMKAVAHREIDLGDIVRLLRRNRDVDLIYVREGIAEFASVLDAPEILVDFNRLASGAGA